MKYILPVRETALMVQSCGQSNLSAKKKMLVINASHKKFNSYQTSENDGEKKANKKVTQGNIF